LRTEAVIVDALRTPMGRGKPGGALSALHPVDLLAQVLRALVDRNDLDPGLVEDVLVGCVSQGGEQAQCPGRGAVLAAGFPEHVPSVTIDRRCGSGQQAIDFAVQAVTAGAYDVVIAGGVESMSRVPIGSARMGQDGHGEAVAKRYGPGLVSQGIAAELVAARWGIGRDEMDAYAVASHDRAARAAAEASFEAEIVPITTGGARVIADETIRPGSRVEKLAGLAPSFVGDEVAARFPEINWSVTAGNSSQLTDGASALLIMSAKRAGELGLRPRARVVASAVCGADPLLMLTAPIPATHRVLDRSGLSLDDMDHVEVNEAFACVPLAWAAEFPEAKERLNPRGGAIALGHPLGASGARLMTTMLHALEQSGGRYGLQTMCEAGGMANATIIETL
jgi:acetyl-CoA acetyltransferase family protein